MLYVTNERLEFLLPKETTTTLNSQTNWQTNIAWLFKNVQQIEWMKNQNSQRTESFRICLDRLNPVVATRACTNDSDGANWYQFDYMLHISQLLFDWYVCCLFGVWKKEEYFVGFCEKTNRTVSIRDNRSHRKVREYRVKLREKAKN